MASRGNTSDDEDGYDTDDKQQSSTSKSKKQRTTYSQNMCGKNSAHICKINKCCCCDLRIGTLVIAWLTLICAVLWIVFTVTDNLGGNVNGTLIILGGLNVILDIITVIFIFLGIYKGKLKLIWAAVYILLFCALLYFAQFVALFVLGYPWIDVIELAVLFPFKFYFFLVVRSYALEVSPSSVDLENDAI